jgi:hypothetical protein
MLVACLLGTLQAGIVWDRLVTIGLMFVLLNVLLWLPFHPRLHRLLTRFDNWTVRREIANNPAYQQGLRHCRVEIGPTGFFCVSGDSSALTAWSDVTDVVLTDEYMYFLYSETSGLPIPRLAFPTDISFRSFFETARTYLDQAKPLPTDAR